MGNFVIILSLPLYSLLEPLYSLLLLIILDFICFKPFKIYFNLFGFVGFNFSFNSLVPFSLNNFSFTILFVTFNFNTVVGGFKLFNSNFYLNSYGFNCFVFSFN